MATWLFVQNQSGAAYYETGADVALGAYLNYTYLNPSDYFGQGSLSIAGHLLRSNEIDAAA